VAGFSTTIESLLAFPLVVCFSVVVAIAYAAFR
jgi:hypothetical protein